MQDQRLSAVYINTKKRKSGLPGVGLGMFDMSKITSCKEDPLVFSQV